MLVQVQWASETVPTKRPVDAEASFAWQGPIRQAGGSGAGRRKRRGPFLGEAMEIPRALV